MRIHALQTGTVAVKRRQLHGQGRGRGRVVRTMLDRDWTDPLPIHAWLIEHPEGLILVDTGETSKVMTPGYFPRWHPYYRLAVRMLVGEDEEIGPRLRELGVSPADVGTVVLTHLHTDHAGGLHDLPSSRVLVHPTELRNASGMRGKVAGYLPHRWPDGFAPDSIAFDDGPWGPFPESSRLTRAGDVLVLPTPGHTPGHVSVAVLEDDRAVVLSGDVAYTQQLMLDGIADGVTDDEATARRTLERFQELVSTQPTVFLPSHDPDARRRLEAREPAGRSPDAAATAE